MANKRPIPEEIVTKLRQVEILTRQEMSRLDAIRQIGVTEQTNCRPRVRCSEYTRLDQGCRSADSLHRTGITL